MLVVRDLRIPGLPPLDFEVAPGEALAVSGPSGAGKTRLLRALADLDPAEGAVSLGGEPRAAVPAPEWRRRVGLLPAEPRFWGPTVASHFPAPPAPAEFAALGLDPGIADAPPARLSTGEKARVAFLRLLARGPEALLLDEPGANLDRENRERLRRRVEAFLRERGGAAVWASHDEAAGGLARRTLLLPEGRVAAAGDRATRASGGTRASGAP